MTSNNTPPPAAGLGIWANLGIWITFGAAFGLLVGGFFDNVTYGVALGPLLGLVLWLVFIAPRRNARRDS
jgi:membrane associated rhomboid family serine protease